MQAKQIYLAEDGTQFDSADKAEMYESVVSLKPAIVAWAKENYNPRLTARYTNLLMFWEGSRDAALAAVPEASAD